MKVWSETLTPQDLADAVREVNAEFPGVGIVLDWEKVVLVAGPNVRRRRIERVRILSGRGRPANTGTHGSDSYTTVASWVEWGWFLARVFERDPNARCGQYHGLDDFHAKTGGLDGRPRFSDPRTPRQRQVMRELARTNA